MERRQPKLRGDANLSAISAGLTPALRSSRTLSAFALGSGARPGLRNTLKQAQSRP